MAIAGWESLPRHLATARVLVNTTTLGMHGQPLLEIDVARLPPDAVVNDLVYVPLETPLVTSARIAGLAPSAASACCCTRRCRASPTGSASVPQVTPALAAAVQKSIEAG